MDQIAISDSFDADSSRGFRLVNLVFNICKFDIKTEKLTSNNYSSKSTTFLMLN